MLLGATITWWALKTKREIDEMVRDELPFFRDHPDDHHVVSLHNYAADDDKSKPCDGMPGRDAYRAHEHPASRARSAWFDPA